MSIQPARTNPITQKIFLTIVVDSLPEDVSQSEHHPVGIIATAAKNGRAEKVPFFVMSNPKTSCMNSGMHDITVKKLQLSAKYATAKAQTGTDLRSFRHGVGGRAAGSAIPFTFSQY